MLVAIFKDILCANAPKYKHKKVASHSNYNKPIPDDGKQHGFSRNWADADLGVQAFICNLLISHFLQAGYAIEKVAFLLLLVRVESGFNPDAAATTTSASGLGQFVNKTRRDLGARIGLQEPEPFCIDTQLKLFDNYLPELFRWAERERKRDSSKCAYCLAYKYHHDGPLSDYGGYGIAQREIIPRMPKTITLVNSLAK